MKKVICVIGFLAMFTIPAAAQETPKIEIFGGPSFLLYSEPNKKHLSMPGWTASGEYSIFHWLSAEAEGTGAYNKGYGYPSGKTSIYAVRLGPVFYPFGHRKLTPFAHFLLGGAYYTHDFPAFGGFPASSYTNVSSSWEGGGGVDLRIKKHWAVRMMELDFAQVNFVGGTTTYSKQSVYRATAGIVYRFGGK